MSNTESYSWAEAVGASVDQAGAVGASFEQADGGESQGAEEATSQGHDVGAGDSQHHDLSATQVGWSSEVQPVSAEEANTGESSSSSSAVQTSSLVHTTVSDYPSELGPRRFGQVDSFDARKGWGFVHDFYTGETFIAHHSEIRPKYPDDRLGEDCIRNFKNCLHQGEYVEFSVGKNPRTGDPCAAWITGPGGGSILMDHAVIQYTMYRDCRSNAHVRPGRGSRSRGNIVSNGQEQPQQQRRKPRLQQRRRQQTNAP